MTGQKLIVIAGPTGSGKSALALRLAREIGGEIVNYDSVQIYRGFDIADAGQEFNAADYGRLAAAVCADIHARGKRAILAGGTFFYLRSLLTGLPEMPGRDESIRTRIRAVARKRGGPERLHRWLSRIDPRSGRKIAPGDRHRVERALEIWLSSGKPISSWDSGGANELPSIKIALAVDRPRLAELIEARVIQMFEAGLIDETRALLERFPPTARPFTTIGYKEAAQVVRGEIPLAVAVAETARRTRAYAKRQMTWLRSERNVHWIDALNQESHLAALRLIEVES